MTANTNLITSFYDAFERRDHARMNACYHPEIHFSDPVFTDLRGDQVRAMWHMLCKRGAGLFVTFSHVHAEDGTGSAHWEKIRESLIPVAKKYTFEKVLDFCRKHHLPKKREYTFAYVLLDKFNDSSENAYRLADALRGIRCKINLIPYNENPVLDMWNKPTEKRVRRFHEILIEKGYNVIIRKSRGLDIDAACGMLRANEEKRRA